MHDLIIFSQRTAGTKNCQSSGGKPRTDGRKKKQTPRQAYQYDFSSYERSFTALSEMRHARMLPQQARKSDHIATVPATAPKPHRKFASSSQTRSRTARRLHAGLHDPHRAKRVSQPTDPPRQRTLKTVQNGLWDIPTTNRTDCPGRLSFPRDSPRRGRGALFLPPFPRRWRNAAKTSRRKLPPEHERKPDTASVPLRCATQA